MEIKVICTATAEGKTGVEMEALTGVSVALLTHPGVAPVVKMCEFHPKCPPYSAVSRLCGASDGL